MTEGSLARAHALETSGRPSLKDSGLFVAVFYPKLIATKQPAEQGNGTTRVRGRKRRPAGSEGAPDAEGPV